MILKIYSDRSYLLPGQEHVVMLYPFWGKRSVDTAHPSSGRFDRYTEVGSCFFEMTTLQKADVAVFPVAYEHVRRNSKARERLRQFAGRARQAGKPTAIFFGSDSDEDVPYGTTVFRTSLYRSSRKPNEFAMPAWSNDFVAKYLGGELPIRPRRARAIVGFCGHAPPKTTSLTLVQRVKRLLSTGKRLLESPKSYGRANAAIRTAALQALAASTWVDTNFIVHERFWGGAFLAGQLDLVGAHRARQQYVQNMVGSDYILCARGGGNFSFRLYEALSCGRIPLFVDTDCVLPYHSEIDWKAYCVWVDEKDIDHIGERVAEFHKSLSLCEFTDLQQRCQRLWENYLSPEGFFMNFYRHFLSQQPTQAEA